MRIWRSVGFGIAVAAIAIVPLVARQPAVPRWPTDTWPSTTPESEGLDSGVLADMLDYIDQHHLPVHSVFIARHGRELLNATFYPYNPREPHDIASATKSITSILVGIAIDAGVLTSVDQPVRELLPREMPATADSQRNAVTVRHLLTMQSGLDCGFEPGELELSRMRQTRDWAAFALSLPMRAAPGTAFTYCSCNNHLLSAILSARTGENALTFARRRLFEPLGIRDAIWPADPVGRTHGWGDLHLRPSDLAKIAYLYLQGGQWNGRRIVSETWIRDSVTPHVSVREGVGYGYSWWVNTARNPNVFEAEGRGGQRAAVLPDKDLIVVFNSGGVNTDDLAPFVLRAIRSDSPLPHNPEAGARLNARLTQARQPPAPHQPRAVPPLARRISRLTYELEQNPLELTQLSFKFSGASQAAIVLSIGSNTWQVPVGLDGRYRFSSTGPLGLPMAARGEWYSSDEFDLELNTVANINNFSIRMIFVEGGIHLRINEATGEIKDVTVDGHVRPEADGRDDLSQHLTEGE